jgi:hypothetical protein
VAGLQNTCVIRNKTIRLRVGKGLQNEPMKKRENSSVRRRRCAHVTTVSQGFTAQGQQHACPLLLTSFECVLVQVIAKTAADLAAEQERAELALRVVEEEAAAAAAAVKEEVTWPSALGRDASYKLSTCEAKDAVRRVVEECSTMEPPPAPDLLQEWLEAMAAERKRVMAEEMEARRQRREQEARENEMVQWVWEAVAELVVDEMVGGVGIEGDRPGIVEQGIEEAREEEEEDR